ncbi:MAG: hypothetical protein J0I20_07345 [Chloroflexi bacterium]|nr:hypothetical protein [Chloroflexota bacterium]OJV95240.1 MAG: hypothetical protein BGO39_24855 [Chloroflexi bacterium 54-19]
MAVTLKEDKSGQKFVRHARCGGEYQVFGPGEVVPDDEDCQICREVQERFQVSHGLNNTATAGTPLAEELGLVVVVDKIGPVAS